MLTVQDGCPGCTEASAYLDGNLVDSTMGEGGWNLHADGGFDTLEWWSFEALLCGLSVED